VIFRVCLCYVEAQKYRMRKPITKLKASRGRSLQLSSKQPVPDQIGSKGSKKSDNFAFSTAGPAVSEAGAKIVGKSLKVASKYLSASSTLRSRPVIATNIHAVNRIANKIRIDSMRPWCCGLTQR
jgi:hypothetical protein